jgi:MerR family copper efflux transcriptional regulator
MTEQLLACALPADKAERKARNTRSTLGAAALSREEVEGGLRLRFPGDSSTEASIREVIAAESRCCPFLDMTVEPRPDGIELTVTAPLEARPMIEQLFAHTASHTFREGE